MPRKHDPFCFVAEPLIVPYGCTPFTPERDANYEGRQDDKTGLFAGPRPRPSRRPCSWCKGKEMGPVEMCPKCQRRSVAVERELAQSRVRSRKIANGEPIVSARRRRDSVVAAG